jgi:hypothetical protein
MNESETAGRLGKNFINMMCSANVKKKFVNTGNKWLKIASGSP